MVARSASRMDANSSMQHTPPIQKRESEGEAKLAVQKLEPCAVPQQCETPRETRSKMKIAVTVVWYR
jgi:hypothetical protein